MDGPAWSYEALPKAALYLAVLTAIGIVTTRGLLLRRASVLSDLDRILTRLGWLASSLALVALALRLLAHTAVVFGAGEALHWDNLRVIGLESRWGQAWRLQVFNAGVLAAGAFAIRVHRKAGWLTFTVAALALCATIPRLGHGATSNTGLVLHSLHLLGVSAWLGTLTVLFALYFGNRQVVESLIPRFATVALAAAALATATGVIAAFIYVGSFSNLVSTTYGRTLLIKLAGFVCIAACGWSNWRRASAGEAPRLQALAAELVFATAVVLVTSVLTEMEHP